jgi:hypothetical protein
MHPRKFPPGWRAEPAQQAEMPPIGRPANLDPTRKITERGSCVTPAYREICLLVGAPLQSRAGHPPMCINATECLQDETCYRALIALQHSAIIEDAVNKGGRNLGFCEDGRLANTYFTVYVMGDGSIVREKLEIGE